MHQFNVPQLHQGFLIEKKHSPSAVDMPEMHSHGFHEIFFLLSGKRRYFLGHEIFDIQSGELVMIPQTVLHRTTALNNSGYERFVIYFHETYISDLIASVTREKFDALLSAGCLQFSKEGAHRLQKMLEQLESENNVQDPYVDAIKKNLLEQIILYLLRCGKKKTQDDNEGANKIQEAARYISKHYNEDIKLSQVAAMAYMEETYFSKKFKSLTGFGFKEYLTFTRINAAENLLLTTPLTISEIADLCGFASSNYFGDAFRHHVGISPSTYRKKTKILR